MTLLTLTPNELRCEYLVSPLAIESANPRLSWVLSSTDRGQKQTAYQVLVASNEEALHNNHGNLWDSGKTAGTETIQIEYAGAKLVSRQRCFWKVRSWDRDDKPSAWSEPASWSMGLLQKSDWTARWIADPQTASGRGTSPTTRHYGFQSAFATTQDIPGSVSIDLGKTRNINAIRIYPANPYGWHETSGFFFPVRFKVETGNHADLSDAVVAVDRTAEDFPHPGMAPQHFAFDSRSARYVRFSVTQRASVAGPHGYAFALAEMDVLANDQVVSTGSQVTSHGAISLGGWAPEFLVDGKSKTGEVRPKPPATMARKDFVVAGKVRRAIAYVSGLGLYELHINGRRVGDHILAPEWTDYRYRVQYQTYDVKSLLQSGNNAIAGMMGDGWLSTLLQTHEFTGKECNRLLVQLEIETEDGKTRTIITDPTWRTTTNGPVRAATIYDGESYDAQREFQGWDQPGFDAGAWHEAAELDDLYTQAKLVSQPNEPIRVVRELTPVAVNQPKPGVWVADLGQNMVGWIRLRGRGAQGQPIQVHHGEMLNEDGTVYVENLRAAPQILSYIPKDGNPFVFEPHFTYMGFRYVQITGLAEPATTQTVTGRVFYSAASDVGIFETSSPQLNALMRLIVWTQWANLMSVPTDCPQRGERLGWMGDIQAFSQTAIFNMDLAAFFKKWTVDMRDAQATDGRFSDFSPNMADPNKALSGCMAWADAGTVVPWRAYQNYADKRLIEEHYDSAKRWVDWIHRNNPTLTDYMRSFGDWLNGDSLNNTGWPTTGGEVPNPVFCTAFFAHSTDIVAKMAKVIGLEDDTKTYGELFEKIKAAFNEKFVTADGKITGETQAGYALALHFDLLPESLRPLAVQNMIDAVARYRGQLSTGIQTTHRLMLELSRYGHHNAALHIAHLKTFPSWGFMLENGATTIWERWDGYVKGRGFQNPVMNSFNHWALGAVGEWMWRDVVGINPDESRPGYKHVIIRPQTGTDENRMTSAKGTYQSIRGAIISDWKIEGTSFKLHAAIPPGVTATVYVPTTNADAITESGTPATRAKGVRFIGVNDGVALFEIDSGSYDFSSPQ